MVKQSAARYCVLIAHNVTCQPWFKASQYNYNDRHKRDTNKLNCDKKAQLSLTNLRDAKACQKIAPIRSAYNVVADKYIKWATILSQTLRVYIYSFSHCCLPKSRNHTKFR